MVVLTDAIIKFGLEILLVCKSLIKSSQTELEFCLMLTRTYSLLHLSIAGIFGIFGGWKECL